MLTALITETNPTIVKRQWRSENTCGYCREHRGCNRRHSKRGEQKPRYKQHRRTA